jgi:putative transposase
VDTERKDDPPWAEYFRVCWHKPGRPSEPQAVKNMLKLLPPEIAAPSYWQVRRWNQKRPLIEREQGRRTGGEMRALKPYWERETRDLRPLEVCLCDGHSFKATIKSWQNGRPIHPEICYVVDVASRAVLGWSIGLAESAETVMTAVLRAAMHGPENPFGGVPNILYTDMGAGNMAKVNTHEVYGFFAKLGITHETGIPGNAQGRGLIERLNKTLWIRAAREMPSCTHAMFDRLAARNFHLAAERDYAQKGDTELLLNLKQFMQYIAEKVMEYNNAPHTSLPKVTDPETGRRRHMSPYEYLAWHATNGWKFEEHQMPLELLDSVSIPSEPRIARRGRIQIRGNRYCCKELAYAEGEAVYVTEEDAEGMRLRVHDETGTLIGTAVFEGHKSQYFPQTRRDEAAKNRLENREKLLLEKLEDVRSEYQRTAIWQRQESLLPARSSLTTTRSTTPGFLGKISLGALLSARHAR